MLPLFHGRRYRRVLIEEQFVDQVGKKGGNHRKVIPRIVRPIVPISPRVSSANVPDLAFQLVRVAIEIWSKKYAPIQDLSERWYGKNKPGKDD